MMDTPVKLLEFRLAAGEFSEVAEIVVQEEDGPEKGCWQEPEKAFGLGSSQPQDDDSGEQAVDQPAGEEKRRGKPGQDQPPPRHGCGAKKRDCHDQRRGCRSVLPHCLAAYSP